MGDYKEPNVWKEAIDLVENICKLIKIFPKERKKKLMRYLILTPNIL